VSVAVTVLVTKTTKTPDLNPTIDALAVLRQSVLAAPAPPATSPAAAFSLNTSFVALVTPDVDFRSRTVIAWLGYQVRLLQPPLEPADVRNKQIAKEVVTDGAMGIAEMVKVYGFTMHEFDYVLMVDADVHFHQSIAHPIADFRTLGGPRASLGWTKGGWEAERINGGFLVFHPAADGRRHFDAIVDTLKEGDFRPGSGWRGKGIGWTYGGRTIQGLLPYYFFSRLVDEEKQHSGSDANDPPTGSGKIANGSFTPADVKLDRCRYNNMVQLDPCKATPLDAVVSNHFTGDCMKPWWCQPPKHPLCGAFVDRWWRRWAETRDALSARAAAAGTAAGAKAASALRGKPAGRKARCPAGGYHALSPLLYEVAHEALHTARPGAAATDESASSIGSEH
jgi:hypothetical protein